MSRSNHRRQWKASEKLRIVLESMQSDRHVAEICRREGLSPNLIYKWRQQLMNSAESVFADKRGQRPKEDPKTRRLETENEKMKNVIAEITAENLVLKKTRSD